MKQNITVSLDAVTLQHARQLAGLTICNPFTAGDLPP